MLTFDVIYSQFLTSVPEAGESLAHLTDSELKKELYNLAVPAIANFKFPQVDLNYIDQVDVDGLVNNATFENNVTQKEINVILALMRVEWMQSIINRESRFEQYYFDANMRTHSQGAMLTQLNRRMEMLHKEARAAIFNYSRSRPDGSVNTDRVKW